jgi:hypothetical protein
MINADIYKHLFDREYMSGVEREKSRIKATGEVFTPTHLVEEILGKMNPVLFNDPTKTFLDPSCGDGQFLASALYRKLQNDIDFETALSTIYGVDLMPDNVEETHTRLLCGREDLRHIVQNNIVCADALRYHYRFSGEHPYDDELKQRQQEELFDSLFD